MPNQHSHALPNSKHRHHSQRIPTNSPQTIITKQASSGRSSSENRRAQTRRVGGEPNQSASNAATRDQNCARYANDHQFDHTQGQEEVNHVRGKCELGTECRAEGGQASLEGGKGRSQIFLSVRGKPERPRLMYPAVFLLCVAPSQCPEQSLWRSEPC